MSAPSFRLELSSLARRDYRDILSFTRQKWGKTQLVAYERKINAALRAIAKNPQKGRIDRGIMRHPVGRHVVFYRIMESARTVHVVRILHERMDADKHLH